MTNILYFILYIYNIKITWLLNKCLSQSHLISLHACARQSLDYSQLESYSAHKMKKGNLLRPQILTLFALFTVKTKDTLNDFDFLLWEFKSEVL